MRIRFRAVGAALALGAVAISVLGVAAPARASAAMQFNNLSSLGTQGEIRARSVFQDGTGATVLQAGVPTDPKTNPNRTIGDAVAAVATPALNTPGPRLLGNNPFAGDGHTHYHAGDTRLLINDVTGFAPPLSSDACGMSIRSCWP